MEQVQSTWRTWRCFPLLQLRCALILRELNQIFIACLFKGCQEQYFFLQTLLCTAFLVTVIKFLTYALVSTWFSVSSGWEHVKRKMHPWYQNSYVTFNSIANNNMRTFILNSNFLFMHLRQRTKRDKTLPRIPRPPVIAVATPPTQ